MKRIFSILLALVMVFSLAACGGSEDGNKGDSKAGIEFSPQGEAEQVAKNFLNAVLTLQMDEVKNYISEDFAGLEDMKSFDMDAMVAETAQSGNITEEQAKAMIEAMLGAVSQAYDSYELASTEQSDAGYVVTFKVAVRDVETATAAYQQSEEYAQLQSRLLSATDEASAVEVMVDLYNATGAAIANADILETIDVQVAVEQQDGKWVVTQANSEGLTQALGSAAF